MEIFGAVNFDDPGQAEKARMLMEREGYDVEVQKQADGAFVVVAVPPTGTSSAEVLVARMQSLADDLGGDFLGHGGSAQHVLG